MSFLSFVWFLRVFSAVSQIIIIVLVSLLSEESRCNNEIIITSLNYYINFCLLSLSKCNSNN